MDMGTEYVEMGTDMGTDMGTETGLETEVDPELDFWGMEVGMELETVTGREMDSEMGF